MIGRVVESIASILYFVVFYSLILLGYVFSKTPLSDWFAGKVKALTPE